VAENWQKLVDILLRKNIVKKKTLNDAIMRYRSTGDTVEKVLVKSGLVTREQLLELKKEAFGLEPWPLDPATVDPAIGQLLPQSMADRYGVLCVERRENTLTLVSAEPLDAIAMDYIRMRSGFEIKFRIAYAADVEEARRRVYSAPPSEGPPAAEFHTVGNPRNESLNRGANRLADVAPRMRTRKTVALPGFESAPIHPGNGVPAAPKAPAPSPSLPALGVRRGLQNRGGTDAPRVIPLGTAAPCAMCAATTEMSRGVDTRQQLEKILQTLMAACDCEAASLLVLEGDGSSLFFKHAVGTGADDIVNMIVPLTEASVAGWVLAHRKPLVVNNTSADPLHNKETDKILQFATHRLAAVPVAYGDRLLGVVEAVNKRLGGFSEADVESLRISAAQVAIALNNETTTQQLSGLVMETVNVLAELLGLQGKVKRSHLVDVAQLATAMGREAGLDAAEMEILSHAGILHDIGILGEDAADDDTLHPRRGAELLARVPMLANLVPHIRMHHERWDGSGPQRLREVQIPLPARILAVAEAWYEKPQDDVFAFLERFGSDFDPGLQDAFLRAFETIKVRGEANAAAP
jgi:hypothetical protein